MIFCCNVNRCPYWAEGNLCKRKMVKLTESGVCGVAVRGGDIYDNKNPDFDAASAVIFTDVASDNGDPAYEQLKLDNF